MKYPIIKLVKASDQIQLYHLLYAMGFKYLDKPTVEDGIESSGLTQRDVDAYPYVCAIIGKKEISGYRNEQSQYKSLDSIGDFIQYILDNSSPPIEVLLNADYKAIVSRDGVKVGCQTFELDVIQKLYDAMLQIKKESGK